MHHDFKAMASDIQMHFTQTTLPQSMDNPRIDLSQRSGPDAPPGANRQSFTHFVHPDQKSMYEAWKAADMIIQDDYFKLLDAVAEVEARAAPNPEDSCILSLFKESKRFESWVPCCKVLTLVDEEIIDAIILHDMPLRYCTDSDFKNKVWRVVHRPGVPSVPLQNGIVAAYLNCICYSDGRGLNKADLNGMLANMQAYIQPIASPEQERLQSQIVQTWRARDLEGTRNQSLREGLDFNDQDINTIDDFVNDQRRLYASQAGPYVLQQAGWCYPGVEGRVRTDYT